MADPAHLPQALLELEVLPLDLFLIHFHDEKTSIPVNRAVGRPPYMDTPFFPALRARFAVNVPCEDCASSAWPMTSAWRLDAGVSYSFGETVEATLLDLGLQYRW